jgi:hypothetical protein
VREDAIVVDRLAMNLRQAGVNVWLDREQLQPGQRWQRSIRSAIGDGAYFLPCFSESYVKRARSYMNEELTVAIEELRLRQTDRSWLIPLQLDATPVPDRDIGGGETLRSLQWVDLGGDWHAGMRRLLTVVAPQFRSPSEIAQTLGVPSPEAALFASAAVLLARGHCVPVVGDWIEPFEQSAILRTLRTILEDDDIARPALLEAMERAQLRTARPFLREELRSALVDDVPMASRPLQELARFPARTFIVLSRTDRLSAEMRSLGRDPQVLTSMMSGDAKTEFSNPTVANPVVFHLLGRLEGEDQVVLSERDYRQIVPEEWPYPVRGEIANCGFLFVGFKYKDASLRQTIAMLDSVRHRPSHYFEFFQFSLESEIEDLLEHTASSAVSIAAMQLIAEMNEFADARDCRIAWTGANSLLAGIVEAMNER